MTAVYRLKNNLWAFDLVALGAGTGGGAFQVDPCFKTKCRPTFLPGPLDPPLLIVRGMLWHSAEGSAWGISSTGGRLSPNIGAGLASGFHGVDRWALQEDDHGQTRHVQTSMTFEQRALFTVLSYTWSDSK